VPERSYGPALFAMEVSFRVGHLYSFDLVMGIVCKDDGVPLGIG